MAYKSEPTTKIQMLDAVEELAAIQDKVLMRHGSPRVLNEQIGKLRSLVKGLPEEVGDGN